MTRANQRRIRDEVRRQRMVAIRQRLLFATLALLALTATGGGLWSLNGMLGISQWKITADAVLRTEIDAALTHMGHLDFWHSQPASLRRQLRRAVPDIAEISVQRRLPDTLVIRARARVPMALWQKGEQLWLIDHQGSAYRPLRRGEARNLPILRLPEARLTDAARLLETMANRHPARLAQLSELVADPEGWKLNLTHGQQWRLSFGLTAMHQMARLERILRKPRWRNGFWRVNTRLETRWFLRPASQQGVI